MILLSKFRLFSLLIFFCFHGFSQNLKTDSIYSSLKTAPTFNDSLEIYKQLGQVLWEFNETEAVMVCEELLQVGKKKQDSLVISLANSGLGLAYNNSEKFELAMIHFKKALDIAVRNNFTSEISANYNNLGMNYYFQNDYYHSLKNYKEALSIARENKNDFYVAYFLSNIAIVYSDIEDHESAYVFLVEALEKFEKVGSPIDISVAKKNLGDVLFKLKKYDEALLYLSDASLIEKEENHTDRYAETKSMIADVYFKLGNNEKAQENYDIALELTHNRTARTKLHAVNVYLNYAEFNYLLGKKAVALQYAKKSYDLVKDKNNFKSELKAVKILSTYYQETQNFKEALKYARIMESLTDSLGKVETQKSLFDELTKLEVEELAYKKDLEIANKDIEIAQNLRNRNTYLLVGVSVFFTILFLVSYFSRNRLKKINKKLTISNEIKSNFLTKMTHEIKTPLNAIIGYSDLLSKNNTLSKEQLTYVNIIKNSGNSLLTMTEDIFDFNRLTKNKLQVNLTPVHLNVLAQEVYDMFKIRTDEKNLNFQLKVSQQLNEEHLIDDYQLRRVLNNLIDNAIKFTTLGSITFTIEVVEDEPKKSNLLISISDTGKGIKHSNGANIFNEFFQEESDYTREHGGIGLGLSLSSKIIHRMGGELKFSSTLGEGSIFYFNLKLEKVISTKPAQAIKVNSNIYKSPHKVLIVEDNKMNLLLTKKMISKINDNIIISEAYDGQMGIEVFAKERPDLVLMDIQMPILNGFEATNIIRKTYSKNVPILALSAGSAAENYEKSKAAGINEYFEKPISLEKFTFIFNKYA